MRNVKQDLANFSGRSVSDIRVGRLVQSYGKKAADRREFDRANEGRYRGDSAVIEQIMLVVANALEEDANQPLHGNLPVTSVFDAIQIINSHKAANTDFGLKALKGHLETKWKRNREANITADDFIEIRDHYTRNYPRSVVGQVINDIGKRGYVTLPLSDLLDIASKIGSQRDFDRLMVENGLHTNQPHHVRARNFILSVLNGE